MTQPFPPGAPPLQVVPSQWTAGMPTPFAPSPLAPPQPAAPSPDDYIAALAAKGRETTRGAQEAQAEHDAEEQRLESEHGVAATIGGQFARGVLDFVMAPAASVAAAAESAGALTGSKVLRDFGRDFGRSAQGSEFLAAINPDTLSSVFSGDRKEAKSAYEFYKADLEEQEEARPMLATVSHLAGNVLPGAVLGGLASGHQALGAALASAAYEGAGVGFQAAYADDAPLQDVLTSGLISATIGAGSVGALHVAGHYVMPAAKRAIQKQAGKIADESTARALGLQGSDAAKLGMSADELGATVRQYELQTGPRAGKRVFWAGGKPADFVEDVSRAQHEIGSDLGRMRDGIDDAIKMRPDLAPDVGGYLKEVDEKILTDTKDSLVPAVRSRAQQVENQLADLRTGLEEGKTPTFKQLKKFQEDLRSVFQPKRLASGGLPPPVPEHAALLEDAERLLSQKLDDSAERALNALGRPDQVAKYKELKHAYWTFRTAHDVVSKAAKKAPGLRSVSLTDYLTGIGSATAALGTGNPMALLAGPAGAMGNKLLRERGRSVIAMMADAIAGEADQGGRFLVSVQEAGGREGQHVISTLERARRRVVAAAEAAGENPAARQAAELSARRELASHLEHSAGEYELAHWAHKPPDALQKFIYRGPLLDQVSTDVAKAAEQASKLRPNMSADIDPTRIARLVKGADGPAAIASVQTRLRSALAEVPKNAQGDELRILLRQSLRRLDQSTTAESMAEGHRLARAFTQLSEGAADDVTRSFAGRQAEGLVQDLSSDAWGEAGGLYRHLVAPATDAFQGLAKPELLRDVLRKAGSRGELTSVVRQELESVRNAYAASSKLIGERESSGLSKTFRELEQLAGKAEDAATLDGGPVARVLDHFAEKPQNRFLSSLGGTPPGGADPGSLVLRVVGPRLGKILKVLPKEVAELSEHVLPHAAVHKAQAAGIEANLGDEVPHTVGRALSRVEQMTQHRERLEALESAQRDTEGEELTAGLSAVHSVAPGAEGKARESYTQKLTQLYQDFPKPEVTLRGGSGYDSLSSDQLRIGNAMWEATTDPMSVFDDFAAGAIDYDKLNYAWKQYPGLKLASQAGLVDMFTTQLSDAQKDKIPEHIYSQLDMLFDMRGRLQLTMAPDFAARMTAAGAATGGKTQPKPGGMLALNTSEPTFTERLSGRK